MIDSKKQDLGGHLVLIVDDDLRIRSYIRTILQGASVEVLEAGDGLTALEVFRVWRNKIDLVITDIRMPRMSGTELAMSLRLDHPGIPLIFVSGDPVPADTIDSETGFLFIEKPFGPKVLLEAARQVFELIPAAG